MRRIDEPKAPWTTGVVPPYELFRALFSRRSRGQIAAWAGDAVDPDQVCVFGARDDDQPVP